MLAHRAVVAYRTAAAQAPPASSPAWRSTVQSDSALAMRAWQGAKETPGGAGGARLSEGVQRLRELDPVRVRRHKHLRSKPHDKRISQRQGACQASPSRGVRALMRSRNPSGSGGSASSSSSSNCAAAVLCASLPVVVRPPTVNSSFTFWPNLCSDSPIFLPTKLTSSAASCAPHA